MGNLFGWLAIITTIIILACYVPWWITLIVAALIGIVYIAFPKYRENIYMGIGAIFVMIGVMALFYMFDRLLDSILPS